MKSNHEPAQSPLSRRHFLWHSASGLGSVALAWLLHRDGRAAAPHSTPKVKRVVQVFCPGGVSHIDTFDYKSELEKHHGEELTGKGKIDTFFAQPGRLAKSPFAFRRHGQCGQWVSELFPHLATCVDDIAFVQSMWSKSSNHTPAAFQMNTGFTMNGFPSLGAWLSYGLGSEATDLPAFVVLPDPRGLPAGGAINWTAGFLPAVHQGVAFRTSGGDPIADLFPVKPADPAAHKASAALLEKMNHDYLDANPGDSALAARIRAYELAAKMQVSVPEAANVDRESEATKRLYGLDHNVTAAFGRNCLLTRRLLERGVRFVQLWHGGAFGSPRINWDAHENLVENHTTQAAVLDRPLSGLLKDLKQRGMLDDTLIVWTTEFGRTPFTQGIGGKGRDHHPHAFTCWLAGGGIKAGTRYGSSDEVGYGVGENPVSVYDLHATVLHLLGIDHKRLTFYHNGIQRRLTVVHGEVVQGLLS
jgi:antitoxin (DNA-binding transcriptional repressor) of toxin-antitoxin stability system